MSASVFHFCQHCRQEISPTINSDEFKYQHRVLNEGLATAGRPQLLTPTGHHVWTTTCPKCGLAWPLKLLRVGRAQLASLRRVTAVLSELRVGNSRGRIEGQRNYKKLQQAKSRRGNAGAGAAYARRKYETRKALEGIDKW